MADVLNVVVLAMPLRGEVITEKEMEVEMEMTLVVVTETIRRNALTVTDMVIAETIWFLLL